MGIKSKIIFVFVLSTAVFFTGGLYLYYYVKAATKEQLYASELVYAQYNHEIMPEVDMATFQANKSIGSRGTTSGHALSSNFTSEFDQGLSDVSIGTFQTSRTASNGGSGYNLRSNKDNSTDRGASSLGGAPLLLYGGKAAEESVVLMKA